VLITPDRNSTWVHPIHDTSNVYPAFGRGSAVLHPAVPLAQVVANVAFSASIAGCIPAPTVASVNGEANELAVRTRYCANSHMRNNDPAVAPLTRRANPTSDWAR